MLSYRNQVTFGKVAASSLILLVQLGMLNEVYRVVSETWRKKGGSVACVKFCLTARPVYLRFIEQVLVAKRNLCEQWILILSILWAISRIDCGVAKISMNTDKNTMWHVNSRCGSWRVFTEAHLKMYWCEMATIVGKLYLLREPILWSRKWYKRGTYRKRHGSNKIWHAGEFWMNSALT